MRFLPISRIIIHHSAGGSWESIKAQHQAKGWGIASAYHWFVEKYGLPGAGRLEKDSSAGTQSWVANHSGIHVCVAGNFETEDPTQEQLNMLERMVTQKMETYGIKPENVLGHRDVGDTLCPGANLYSKISDMTFKIPDWARLACDKAGRKGIITKNYNENIPAYRLCVILDKLGLLDK